MVVLCTLPSIQFYKEIEVIFSGLIFGFRKPKICFLDIPGCTAVIVFAEHFFKQGSVGYNHTLNFIEM